MIVLEGIKHLKHTDASAACVLVSLDGVLVGAMSSSQILEATRGSQGNRGSLVRYRRDNKGELILRDDAIGSADTETVYGDIEFYCQEPRT